MKALARLLRHIRARLRRRGPAPPPQWRWDELGHVGVRHLRADEFLNGDDQREDDGWLARRPGYLVTQCEPREGQHR
jgi:hypothetical protein